MPLLDASGIPIPAADIAKLRQEISPPNAALGRPPFAGHLAFGIDPGRMGAILRAADSGNSMDWLILAEEIEELFSHYSAVLAKRRRQVAQLPITVTAAEDVADGEEHADFVRAWLDTKVLQRAMFDVTDAIGKGFSVSEIMWDSQPGKVVPRELAYRPPRFFEISWMDGVTVWLRNEQGFSDLMPHKFLLHSHRSKSGLVIRSGLTRAVAWLWMYSSYTLKDWALFTQSYGLPIRVGRYGPEASENDKRVLWRAVSSIAGDVAAIIPKSMELEFIKDTDRAAGSKLYMDRADWLNREVSKLVLGSTAGTEAIHGGHAVGKEHREVEADVERFDAFLLESSIDRQLVSTMIAFTFGPQTAYPTVTIGQPDQVPIATVIDAVTDLGGMGLKVKASEIRDRLQLTEPEADDETIGGAPEPPPPSPDIPRPPIKLLPAPMTGGFLGGLITRHVEAPPEIIDALTQRLAVEAAGALAGLTDQVRHAFEHAADMHDLAHRLHGLKLNSSAFAEAMARGMALSQLVGQVSLIEELHHRSNTTKE